MEKITNSEHGAVRFINPRTGDYQEKPEEIPRRMSVRHFLSANHDLNRTPKLKRYRNYFREHGMKNWDEVTINEIYGLIQKRKERERWN